MAVIGLAAIVVATLAGCARSVLTSPSRPPGLGDEEIGLASWYGHPYHGRPTSSGEVYDMRDLTAAHRTLPFGTRLRVTNLENGQVVDVRVNDRGPFVDARILDLSYAAASVLGAVGPGVIRVRLRVIALPGAPAASRQPADPSGLFYVQLGAFTSRARADRLREAVEREGVPGTVSESAAGADILYRVRVGPYRGRQAARAVAELLAERGYQTVLVADR